MVVTRDSCHIACISFPEDALKHFGIKMFSFGVRVHSNVISQISKIIKLRGVLMFFVSRSKISTH